jgi:hypothetical protein
MESEKPTETYIIQNVTLGPHYISDMKLGIAPLEVVDLTFRDPAEVKGSQNLKDSLRSGLLRKITPVEAERIAVIKSAQMRRDVVKLQQNSRTQEMNIDGKVLEVEPVNLSRSDGAKMSDQVSSAGYANDAMSYAVALDIAQAQASARGEELEVEEFAAMVSNNTDLVRRLITENTNAITSMGATHGKDSRAVYTVPPEEGHTHASVKSQRMKAVEIDATDHGDAEAIDLTQDV